MNEDCELEGLEIMTRNTRVPKKANHGQSPCSHYGRMGRVKARGLLT